MNDDPCLVGSAFLMAKGLCDDLDYALISDGNKASAKDCNGMFLMSAVEGTYLDSLLLLISKLQVAANILKKRSE